MPDNEKSTFNSAEQAAMSHAWAYFAFHAQQRQTVFNFFLILVGASIAAYAGTLGKSEAIYFHLMIGFLISISSVLFWRLDKRNARLVKLAEKPLKAFESRLAEQTNLRSMEILSEADTKVGGPVWSMLETFKQIFRVVFLFTGLVGVAIFCLSLKQSLC
jgi:hypothetical protein